MCEEGRGFQVKNMEGTVRLWPLMVQQISREGLESLPLSWWLGGHWHPGRSV